MQHPRVYSYEESSGYHGSDQPPRHQDHLYSTTAPSFDRAHQQPQTSRPYYVQPPSDNPDVAQQEPYFDNLSSTFSSAALGYPGGNRLPYYPPSAGTPSHSSPTNTSPYQVHGAYPATRYTEHQAHSVLHTQPSENQFIPTPSEIYNSYPPQQISLTPRSPTQTPYSVPCYPSSIPTVSSSQSPEQRIARTSLSRSQNSPATGSAGANGERFPCERCGKTFSRSHDRKRHHETQHLASPVIHRCRYCEKEFSRADSLKRHLDNGCDEMPET